MSTLPVMSWNYQNELSSTSRQAVEKDSVPETTYYRYDTKGKRVRKITERHSGHDETPTVLKERVYIGIFERFRKYSGDETLALERETLRLGDDQADFVIVETRTKGEDKGVAQVIRYQIKNLISSVTAELGQDSELISYEEYSAYGETTYQAAESDLEAPKRYRFSGKELDSENGLYYYGARYYAPHVYRWINCDPGGLADGLNLYEFTKNNPISKGDSSGMEASWFNRATGVLKAVGGVMEIAVGAAGVAAPTGVTQVLGVIAIAHGLDTAWSGIKQAYTGEDQKTYTEQGVTSFAEDKLHMSKGKAEALGAGVDIALGIIPEAGIGAARAGVKVLGKAEGLYQGAKALAKATGEAVVETAKDVAKVAVKVKDVVMGEVRVGQLALAGAEHGAGTPLDGFVMMSKELGKDMSAAMKRAGRARSQLIARRIAKLKAAAKNFPRFQGNPEAYQKWLQWMKDSSEAHLFPRGEGGWLQRQFKAAGIKDINEFIADISNALHHVGHGSWKKTVNLGLNWNKEWKEFFLLKKKEGIKVTKDMVFKQLGKMMIKYGLVSDWNKWTRYTGTPY
jgi:RHS repeat-associated protein